MGRTRTVGFVKYSISSTENIIDRVTRILMYCQYGITMPVEKSDIESSLFVYRR